MDVSELTNLSVSGFTLLILFFIVKFFVASMTSKDAQIKEMTAGFNKTINNHIIHETIQRKRETEALESLTKAIDRLVDHNKDQKKKR